MSAPTWPEGVIARYVTVGGGTVDLRHDATYLNQSEPKETIATCAACNARSIERWPDHAFRNDNGSESADATAGEWAQDHAATCRAMPRPGGAQ